MAELPWICPKILFLSAYLHTQVQTGCVYDNDIHHMTLFVHLENQEPARVLWSEHGSLTLPEHEVFGLAVASRDWWVVTHLPFTIHEHSLAVIQDKN